MQSQAAVQRSRGDDGQRSRGDWSNRQRSEPTQQATQGGRRGDRSFSRGDQGQRSWRRGDGGQNTSAGTRDSAYPDAWQGDPNDPRRQHYERLERRNQYRNGTQQQRQDVRREWQERGEWRDGRDGRGDRDGRRDWRGDRNGRNDWSRSWDRHSWRNDRRYDWQSWRYRNRSLFRSPYYSPFRNHRYSRFSIGLFLEPLFYSQRYWLSDPWQYRLPYAPPGTQWVRYYNDVLLVDTYSGEVVDVIYNFFW